ncbi:MAG: EutN/CcmL family microcompartment protein [Planctomycetaceae bacterium]|jgi:ethanolamine utilization protein EutN|nr:EutN/CcmL family microcompartment protein [Planctomycetaceae bacterium]
MIKAKVIGTTTSTIKHPSLEGWKLLLVSDGFDVYVALDLFGAGEGDNVIVTNDGAYASEVVKSKNSPARWCVIGIIDQIDSNKIN